MPNDMEYDNWKNETTIYLIVPFVKQNKTEQNKPENTSVMQEAHQSQMNIVYQDTNTSLQ